MLLCKKIKDEHSPLFFIEIVKSAEVPQSVRKGTQE